MCFAKAPKPTPIIQPTKTDVVSNENSVSTQMQQERRRRGFQSTVATSGMGVASSAPIKKTQLGG